MAKKKTIVRKWRMYECGDYPKLLLAAKEADYSKASMKIVETYCSLSTEYQPATWEQVAEKLNMPQDKKSQRTIQGVLTQAARARRDFCNEPEPYLVQRPEE